MALTYNGEIVSLADSPAARAENEPYWEVRGRAAAEYRLTELDQEDPAGRYRTRVEGGAYLLQRKTGTAANGGVETWKTYLSLDEEGLFLEPLNVNQSQLLEAMWQYLKEIREVLEWAVEGRHDHE